MTGKAGRHDEAAVQWAVDQVAIRHLQSTYGDAVSRRAWDELAPLFEEGCPVTLDLGDGTTRNMIGGPSVASFVTGALERFEFFEFALLNAVVHLEPGADVAHGRVYMWELRQDAETHRWSNAYGLYRDRYAFDDGRWRFAERRYSSLARSDPDGHGMSVFPIPG